MNRLVFTVLGFCTFAHAEERPDYKSGGDLLGIATYPDMPILLDQKLSSRESAQATRSSSGCSTIEMIIFGKVYRFADPACK